MYGVTQDMMLTVGVGTYDVELQSADMTATKKVTIKKDATSTLDFSEYKQLSAKRVQSTSQLHQRMQLWQ